MTPHYLLSYFFGVAIFAIGMVACYLLGLVIHHPGVAGELGFIIGSLAGLSWTAFLFLKESQ